jgi:hypothetical protein
MRRYYDNSGEMFADYPAPKRVGLAVAATLAVFVAALLLRFWPAISSAVMAWFQEAF